MVKEGFGENRFCERNVCEYCGWLGLVILWMSIYWLNCKVIMLDKVKEKESM